MQDHFGAFVAAYSKHLGVCSVVQAELWGILLGVRLLRERSIPQVVIELDSTTCIGMISTGCVASHPCASMVEEIRRILRTFVQVTWGHVFREANSVVDALEKFGMDPGIGFCRFQSLPGFCSVPFLSDSASMIYYRGL